MSFPNGMQWIFYTINLVTSLFMILPLVVMPSKKEWKLKRKTHTLNLSFHKTSTTNVHPNPSDSSTNPQIPYYSWATPQNQTHQLLLKLITCNMFVYSLSYNIPFFLLTTIHLIFFAKLKSSNLTSPLAFSLQPHGKYSITHDFTLTSSNKSQNSTTSTL